MLASSASSIALIGSGGKFVVSLTLPCIPTRPSLFTAAGHVVLKCRLVIARRPCDHERMPSRNRPNTRIKTPPVAPLVRASHNVVSKRVGYVRVSTVSQSLDQQQDALLAADCSVVWSDHGISGSVRERTGLDAA